MERMLTVKAAAELMGLHPNKVRRMLADLHAVDWNRGRTKNRCIRIPEEAILAYLRGCEIMDPLPERVITNKPFRLERRKA